MEPELKLKKALHVVARICLFVFSSLDAGIQAQVARAKAEESLLQLPLGPRSSQLELRSFAQRRMWVSVLSGLRQMRKLSSLAYRVKAMCFGNCQPAKHSQDSQKYLAMQLSEGARTSPTLHHPSSPASPGKVHEQKPAKKAHIMTCPKHGSIL